LKQLFSENDFKDSESLPFRENFQKMLRSLRGIKKVYLIFIDFHKAFDITIPHELCSRNYTTMEFKENL